MNITPSLIAVVLCFFAIGSVSAQSPNPAFPVGSIAASPTMNGGNPVLQWSINLPDGGNPGNYVHHIREVPLTSGITHDIAVGISGQMIAPLPIGQGGARFELWTIRISPSLREYFLDSTVVGASLPSATVTIRSEDPYSILPRTRADRPFHVDLTVQGILSGTNVPDISKSVNLLRFVQPYGTTGTGTNIDRSQASLLNQSSITTNGTQTFSYQLSAIPGTNPMKRRGEERFSVYSPEDYTMPDSAVPPAHSFSVPTETRSQIFMRLKVSAP